MTNGGNANGRCLYKDYVAGWLDSSIRDFLAFLPRASTRMSFAWIASLDSDLSPAKLLDESPELRFLGNAAKPLHAGILVPTSLLLTASARIFHGFDEVWFFPHDKITAKPTTAWLIGPNRINQSKLNELGPWIAANDCCLALGDGDGLNFLIKARGLVRHLLAFSLAQPRPQTGGEEEAVEEEIHAR